MDNKFKSYICYRFFFFSRILLVGCKVNSVKIAYYRREKIGQYVAKCVRKRVNQFYAGRETGR